MKAVFFKNLQLSRVIRFLYLIPHVGGTQWRLLQMHRGENIFHAASWQNGISERATKLHFHKDMIIPFPRVTDLGDFQKWVQKQREIRSVFQSWSWDVSWWSTNDLLNNRMPSWEVLVWAAIAFRSVWGMWKFPYHLKSFQRPIRHDMTLEHLAWTTAKKNIYGNELYKKWKWRAAQGVELQARRWALSVTHKRT